jgi:beta-galactosidase
LWSVENPYLYKARLTLQQDGKIVDEYSQKFGVRSIKFDAETGFTLNGKTVKLKGGCIHHDNGPLGSVAIDRAEERKIELLKQNGYNAVRLAHNPFSSKLLEACDRLGLLVINETFDMWFKNLIMPTILKNGGKDLTANFQRYKSCNLVILMKFEIIDTTGYQL